MLEQAILKAQTKSVAMLECTPINLALFCLQTTKISFASYSRLYHWVDRSWTPASFVVQRVGDVDGAKKKLRRTKPGRPDLLLLVGPTARHAK